MKVHIKNFQSAADVELEIKGFTTVVGKSNIGKSALIRAIQGALTNREGDNFVTNGESHTEVTLDCPALNLTWKKGGGYNDYLIGDKKLESVGRGNPPQVEKAGFGELKVGRDSISVQIADQFHPLFLLDATGSLAAEAISDVGRLTDIQTALRNCDKDRRSVRSTRKVRQEDLDETREELNRYENYDDDMEQIKEVRGYHKSITALSRVLDVLERMETKRSLTTSQIQSLDGVLEVGVPEIEVTSFVRELELLERFEVRLKRGVVTLKRYRGVDKIEVPAISVDGILLSVKDLESLATKASKIQRDLTRYSGVEEVEVLDVDTENLLSEVKILETIATKSTKIKKDLNVFEGLGDLEIPEMEDLTEDLSEYEELAALGESWDRLFAAIPALKTEVKDLGEDIDSLKEELHEVLHEAGSCPTCERDVL